MVPLNITIVGAGALGVYFGGRLQEAGEDVTFLVREKRAQQIVKEGLCLHSVKGDYDFPTVHIAKTLEDIHHVDLAILSVKGYHLNGVIETLKGLVKRGAKILPVLNGVEHFSILQEELGRENVLGGLSFIMATLDEKGHVYHNSTQHKLTYGPLDDSQGDFCEQLSEVFSGANLEYELCDSNSMKEAIWEKYMFISAFSGLTAAADLTIGQIRPHQATLNIGNRILLEMKTLAKGYGIHLREEHVAKAWNLFNSFPDEGTSSMHQDKRKGLPLELDHLHGGALRMAEKMNIHLPTIEFIHALLKPYENGKAGQGV